MRAITGRTSEMSTLTGILERDRHDYDDYVKLSGTFVKHWIWDELKRFKPNQKVKITIEVLDG